MMCPYFYETNAYFEKEQPGLLHILTQFSISVLEYMGVVLYYKGYQMIELFILLQLI